MKLLSLAAAAITTATALVSPAEAAQTSYCYRNTSGRHVCIHSVRKSKNFYNDRKKYVVASVDGGPRDAGWITCPRGIENNYEENMYGIACYQFN